MGTVKLLDCTLRDGGYLVDKSFSESIVHNIVNGLTLAGVDFVELGFLQENIEKKENVCFINSAGARKYIPAERKSTLYTAFADYSRYSAKNLDEFDGLSFECVRACFFKEERKDAIGFLKDIQRKEYKVFMQPVGILRYSNAELIDLLADTNEIMPYCFSIVDTFGSMYLEDLRLKLALIHSELSHDIMLGFHSHNNKEMSNALSMEFVQIMKGERDICVDATLYGMGKGAGNTRTEIVVDYLNKRHGKNYRLHTLLDVIDSSVSGFSDQLGWGYDLSMYLAGIHSSHINNVDYLLGKAGLRTKDVSWILGRLTDEERSRYDYARLDELYHQCIKKEHDRDDVEVLRRVMQGKCVLVVVPGNTVSTHESDISGFIAKAKPLVVSINFVPSKIEADYVYFNNPRRYDFFQSSGQLAGKRTILTSNVDAGDGNSSMVPVERILSGTDDNSAILLLNLLDLLGVSEVALAGFDGFTEHGRNYVYDELVKPSAAPHAKNEKISALFSDFLGRTKIGKISFVTPSVFDRPRGAR